MVDMDDLVKAFQCLLEVEDMQVLMNTSIWRAEHGSGQDMKRRGRCSYSLQGMYTSIKYETFCVINIWWL